MKNATLTILTFTLIILIGCKEEVLDPNTYIVEKPGYLVTMINEVDRNILTELKIKGNIDARDINFLKHKVINLAILDLSDAKIHSFTGTGGTKHSSGEPPTYIENELPHSAFSDLKTLKTIVLPKNLTSIAGRCFYDCSRLESIIIPSTVKSISGDYTFYGCSSLKSIEIPNLVTSLGNNTFMYCYSLQNVTIGNSVTAIGISVFEKCTNLISVEIPNSVLTIASSAFRECTNLKNISIGNSVNSIGTAAFFKCTSLEKISFANSAPPVAGSDTYYDVNKNTCTLEVPYGASSAYKTAPYWKDFKNIVERDH
jgi:Leucine-rich repeat (LRR) protein